MSEIEKAGSGAKPIAVRIAGVMFLLAFLVPTLNWALVLSPLNAADDIAATARNILANELQFRIGLTVELFMAVFLIVLAVALYAILKSVNRSLAQFALLVKLAEATLSAAIVLTSFVSLQMTAAASQSAAGVMLAGHPAFFAVPMVLLGIDMMVFSYLFLKSKYIPGWLAWSGIVSFALIFIHSLVFILAPESAARPAVQGIFYGPSGLFEIVIGIWFLAKGIEVST